MHYPEICFWMPTVWSVMFLVWGQASAEGARDVPAAAVPEEGSRQKLERPQEDLEDIVLDEARQSTAGARAASRTSAA